MSPKVSDIFVMIAYISDYFRVFFARFGGLQLATVVCVMAFAHVWVQIYLACAWKNLLVVWKKNATFVAISIYVCECACICG